MTVKLDLEQVQVAVADYLRKHGVVVEPMRVALEIRDRSDSRMGIAGCSAVVIVYDAAFPPDEPYRQAAAGALKP